MRPRVTLARCHMGQSIRIDIPLDLLRFATENPTGFKVTSIRAFSLAVVDALNCEEEDGSTFVTRMMDDAISDAIEQGAEGVSE